MITAQGTFAYKARDQGGALVSGTITATTAEEVAARLRSEGKFVVSVEQSARAGDEIDAAQLRRSEAAKRVRRDDVIAFCQQLSVMLETGVPLTEALESIQQQAPRKEFGTVIGILHENICAGEKFSDSMARWPRIFPTMIVSLMKASEASGTMAMMLGRVGEYLAKEQRTSRQIKGAMTYPAFMIGTAMALTIALMAFVLPKFAKIYEMRSATLPLPTKALLAMSDFVTQQYWYYAPALVTVSVALFWFIRQPSGRRTCDWLRLHSPVIGRMYAQLYTTRAARTMATLLSSGVNLLDIISICRGVTNNSHFDRMWTEMEQGVRDGRQISQAVFKSPYISRHVASMIASGERSGRMAEVMERIASFSEEELDASVKKTTSFIEPVMIITMGFVVGGVAMALLLPIFSMGKVMSAT